MKRTTVFVLALVLLASFQVKGWAATKTFTVSAEVPLATDVGITASRVSSATGNWTALAGTALNFDPLTFNSTNSAWFPDHYFAIDVAATGAGNTDVTVTYTEGANPNSATTGHGLGWKSTATFMKVAGPTETLLSAHGKKLLKSVSGEHILPAETSGASLRIYLGIVTKDPNATVADPADAELFTNSDRPGIYDGTLVITATAI